MLTLIRREAYDNLMYLVGLCLVTAMLISLLILAAYEEIQGLQEGYVVPLGLLIFMLLIGFCALGAAQMYGDRANRVSPLLTTLAVTRNQILAARVLTGLLAVLVVLLPVVVTGVILLRTFVPPLEFYRRMVVEVSVTLALAACACHSAGLLIGWTTNRVRLLVGTVLLVAAVVSLLWIKGFGPGVMGVLLLFIGATLGRTWHTFTSSSL